LEEKFNSNSNKNVIIPINPNKRPTIINIDKTKNRMLERDNELIRSIRYS
jgi:hypothetical protein